MTPSKKSESSTAIRDRVISARNRQKLRFESHPAIHNNAMMPPQMVKNICSINAAGKLLLKTAMDRLGLSARAYDRILKVARTIADLAGKDDILIVRNKMCNAVSISCNIIGVIFTNISIYLFNHFCFSM